MNKILVHLRAPVMSLSGYGAHSRMWMDYLLSDDRFIVFLENVGWGGCPWIHEQDLIDKESIKKYYAAIANYEQAQQQNQQYNISIQVTIPNEFSRRAQLNIGVTAGIEVDRCTPAWIQKCNEMDMIIVPSKFSAKGLVETAYHVEQNGKKLDLKLEKPVHILPEWFNRPQDIKPSKFSFSTKKNLLFVGLWGNKGGFGEDRKNISDLLRMFLDENKDNPNVGLVLKTSIITNSPEDLHHTISKINQIKANFPTAKCKIHLIHQSLNEEEMWSLYHHPQIQGFVSLTNGEGFGLPLLEAAASGKPIIATDWSGHLDFLREKNGYLPVKYELKEIPECQHWEGVMEKGSKWAKVDEQDARRRIRKFLDSSIAVEKIAKENVVWLDQNFSKTAVLLKMKTFFDELLQSPNQQNDEGEVVDEKVLAIRHHQNQVLVIAQKIKEKCGVSDEKKSVAFMIPRSFGDCVISTAVIKSLLVRHEEDDFYIVTTPQYREIFDAFKDNTSVKIVDWDDIFMNDEIVRNVWTYVYNPTINIQYQFSNWTLGNGQFGVRILEEMAKHCNVYPKDLYGYSLVPQKCSLPKKQYVSITPVLLKQSKDYKYWEDVVFNLKKMGNFEIIQLGDASETLLKDVLDYRGKSFNETMYVVSRSILHISPDTGTAHVAAAFEVPHIVLFGSTNYNQCAPVLFNKEVPQVIVEALEGCNPKCYKDVCCKMKDGKNCLSAILPSTVSSVVFDILKSLKEGTKKLPILRLNSKEIEEKIDYWHDNSTETDLHDFLGLTKDQYAKYVENKFEEL